jgi:predicted O-linked N-acetylglucosamine transferase (SPINDLY family)
MEPDGGAAHYSEILHALPGLNFDYAPPGDRGPLKDRAALGLPEGARLYVCPQARFKFHPDFDPMVQAILGGDGDGLLVLTAGHNPLLDERYVTRLTAADPALARRVHIMPGLSRRDFVALTAVADIVLDTPHFSGGYSSQEIFSVGTPIVTWPGRFMRGRHTAGFYRLMDIADPVARDPADYAALALEIARNRDHRSDLARRIRDRRHILADNRDTIPAMTAVLAGAAP